MDFMQQMTTEALWEFIPEVGEEHNYYCVLWPNVWYHADYSKSYFIQQQIQPFFLSLFSDIWLDHVCQYRQVWQNMLFFLSKEWLWPNLHTLFPFPA